MRAPLFILLMLLVTIPASGTGLPDDCSDVAVFAHERLGPRCVVVASGEDVTFMITDFNPHWPGEMLKENPRQDSCFDFRVEHGRFQNFSDMYVVSFRADAGKVQASVDDGATWRDCLTAESGAVVAFCHVHIRVIGRVVVE